MNTKGARLSQIHHLLGQTTSSPYSHDMVELGLATATSLPLCRQEHACPVWIMIAGNPSSGKTEGIFALKGVPGVYFVDTMTENSFLSGYVSEGKKLEKQFLDEINGQCLLIKDLTTLFSLREDKIKKLLGELQSIYDGEYIKATGTVGVLRSESVFSMIACVTPYALRQHQRYMSMIGSRFLFYRVPPLEEDQRQEGFDMLWNENGQDGTVAALRNAVQDHVLDVMQNPTSLLSETAEQRQALNQLAVLLARGRGLILTEKTTRLDERTGLETHLYEVTDVQIEEPFRAVQQLRTLARALARIHGRDRVTDHELQIVRRVVLSSMLHDRSKIVPLFPLYGGRLTSKDIQRELGKGSSTAHEWLKELQALNLITKDDESGQYSPHAEIEKAIMSRSDGIDHLGDLESETHDDSPNCPQGSGLTSISEVLLGEKDGPQAEIPDTPGGTLVNECRDDLWREMAGDMT
ncbi:hypothetical protein [Nitrospira sp. Nam74]